MPRRTVSLVALKAHPARKPKDDALELDNIDGADLLDIFETWASAVDPSRLTDYRTGKYLNISDVQRSGRSVLLQVKAGSFGEAGDTVDAHTHALVHERRAEEPATLPHRMMLVLPPRATRAVFAIEYVGGSVSIRRIIDDFKGYLREKLSQATFESDTVYMSDAWLEGARLREVRAVAYAKPVDLADGLEAQPKFTGTVQHVLQPDKGVGWLPSWLLPALRNKKITAAEILSLPDNFTTDKTTVTISNHGREKTFAVDDARRPAVRTLISDDHEPMATTPEFVDKSMLEVRDFYNEMGFEWNEQWRNDPRPSTAMAPQSAPATV